MNIHELNSMGFMYGTLAKAVYIRTEEASQVTDDHIHRQTTVVKDRSYSPNNNRKQITVVMIFEEEE